MIADQNSFDATKNQRNFGFLPFIICIFTRQI